MTYDDNASVEKSSSIHTIAAVYITDEMLNERRKKNRKSRQRWSMWPNIKISFLFFGSHFAPFHSTICLYSPKLKSRIEIIWITIFRPNILIQFS